MAYCYGACLPRKRAVIWFNPIMMVLGPHIIYLVGTSHSGVVQSCPPALEGSQKAFNGNGG